MTLAAALLLSTVIGSGFMAGAVVVVIWGVAFGLVPVAFTGWMMDAVPDVPEAGQALLVTSFQIATASATLIGGLMRDRHGISSAMVLSGSLVLMAALIVGLIGRARQGAALTASL